MYEIISLEQELSGNWRARVLVNSAETAFFKFHFEPSQENIDDEVVKYLENLNVLAE